MFTYSNNFDNMKKYHMKNIFLHMSSVFIKYGLSYHISILRSIYIGKIELNNNC